MKVAFKPLISATSLCACVFFGATGYLNIAAPDAHAESDPAEISFWNSVRDTKDPQELKSFIATFPTSKFQPLAKLRLQKLMKAANSPTVAPKSTLEEKAQSGDVASMVALAENYRWGKNGTPKDILRALDWWKKAAETGDVESLYKVGEHYVYGLYELNGTRDWTSALVWYRRAAEQGHTSSMFMIGHAYQYGIGTAKSSKKAIEWYQRAAELDNAGAMVRLAGMYAKGEGGYINTASARSWYLKAAKKGDLHAHFSLGRMYEAGNGVRRDAKQAAYHFFNGFATPMRGHFDGYMKEASTWSLSTRKQIQKRLSELGLYEGSIDGQFGRGTTRALRSLPKTAKERVIVEPTNALKEGKKEHDLGDIKDLETLD